MNDDWRYSPEKMKLREEVLQILQEVWWTDGWSSS